VGVNQACQSRLSASPFESSQGRAHVRRHSESIGGFSRRAAIAMRRSAVSQGCLRACVRLRGSSPSWPSHRSSS
jgi:hypothetical protein